ncbi:hypothetical protein KEM56_001557 [Ascosphaera pollenicola]|nr:hypothetical protein KEM56_001557 [Ascosphaera pollenicola]
MDPGFILKRNMKGPMISWKTVHLQPVQAHGQLACFQPALRGQLDNDFGDRYKPSVNFAVDDNHRWPRGEGNRYLFLSLHFTEEDVRTSVEYATKLDLYGNENERITAPNERILKYREWADILNWFRALERLEIKGLQKGEEAYMYNPLAHQLDELCQA